MAESYDSFRALTYFDFERDSSNYQDESYFDFSHSEDRRKSESNGFQSCIQDTPESMNKTPESDPFDDRPVLQLRKSMSVGNLVMFNEENQVLEDLSQNVEKLNVVGSNLRDSKQTVKTDCRNTHRRVNQEHLNELAKPKRYASVEDVGESAKHVTLAEYIIHYQNDTPERFRSKPNLTNQQLHKAIRLCTTKPYSPILQTKTRSRPIQVLSQEEKERIEFENQQKFKIKARQINKKILHGPVKPIAPIEKKPLTIMEPFNLTAVAAPKKVEESAKHVFLAKPAPKSTARPPTPKLVHKHAPTKPITPTFMKNFKKTIQEPEIVNQPTISDNRPTRTIPKPFSFEGRDKMIAKKRESLIKKVLEEERKAREFHAKPVPKLIRSASRDSTRSESGGSIGSSRKTQSTENLTIQFKAKKPVVLYKEPFIPARAEKSITKVEPFHLYTDLRLVEREEFERHKQEKEQTLALHKQMEEEYRLREEREEILRTRKEMEYKAQPIRKYKEVIIQPSNKVTCPVSPNFHTSAHKNKNKENIPNN